MLSTKSDRSQNGALLQRQYFGPQPARILLLDSNVLLEGVMSRSVVEALEKIFLLGANLNGPCHIPLIGIYLLSVYPKQILPLNHTKSNFVRLHSVLNDLHAFTADQGNQFTNAPSCINEGVLEACREFRRYMANMKTVTSQFHQLEIVLMTRTQESDLKKQFTILPEEADLNVLKRIVCASVTTLLSDPSASSLSSPQDTSMCDDFTSLVDMVILESDPSSLQKFLYSWMSEGSTSTEQMQLILPPSTPVDACLIIKCDLSESLINPMCLGNLESFSVDTLTNVCKHNFPPPSRLATLQVPIYQLKVLHKLPRDSVCDSLLFGQPVLVHATGCWTMEWEVLEKNQRIFHALCCQLKKGDQVLLARSYYPQQDYISNEHDVNSISYFNNGGGQWSKPSGYFILLPSNKSLLVKSIACGELYLPSPNQLPQGEVSDENMLCIQSSLSKVSEVDQFNPLHFSSGLFDSLRASSLPKSYFNKSKTYHQPKSKPQKQASFSRVIKPTKTDKPSVHPLPGGRITASGWSNTITDVRGPFKRQC